MQQYHCSHYAASVQPAVHPHLTASPWPGGHRGDAGQFEKLGITCEETYTVEGYETSETIVKSYGLTWER